jgi:hypothetical protein
MGQSNHKKTNTSIQPPSGYVGFKFDDQSRPVRVNEDGTTTLFAMEGEEDETGLSANIIANRGIGLYADLPETFVSGDIYVTNDTYRIYTAVDEISWSSTPLIKGQFVSDVVSLQQFNGTDLIVKAGAGVPIDFLDYSPQSTDPSYQEARQWYSEAVRGLLYFDENPLTPPIIQGRSLRARVVNDTGVAIPKGKFVYVTGLSGRFPIIELADNRQRGHVDTLIGCTMVEIPASGGQAQIAVFDSIIGVDTSGLQPNQLVYLGTDGDFTGTKPTAPSYAYVVGFVSIVDAVNGVIGVRIGGFGLSDTAVNLEGALNGVVTHTPDVDFTVSGGVIYADVTNEQYPALDLPFMIADKSYLLNTTTNTGAGGAARVIVPPGADAVTKQASIIYAYLNNGVPDIGIGTTAPAFPHDIISRQAVFDATRTDSDGQPFAYRRSNNAVDYLDGTHDGSHGIIEQILRMMRLKLGSNWLLGQDPTPTVDNTQIRLALSAGLGAQFRESSLPAFDGLNYLIYNDISNQATYQHSTNLTDITQDANGNSLLSNNTYYTIRIFYQLNSNGIGNYVIATRPLGKYTTPDEAKRDPLNYNVSVNDTDIEEVIYPLYDMVIGRTGTGGTTITLIELKYRRSKLPTGGGGGGAAGGAGTDDKTRITASDTTNDYLNPKVAVSGGLTKSTLNPGGNEQLQIELPTTITKNLQKFSGQAVGGDHIQSFSSTPEFNFNNGNAQQITLTGNITSWTIAQEQPAGSYEIFFVQDGTGGRTIPNPTGVDHIDTSLGWAITANDINVVNVLVMPDGTTICVLAHKIIVE